MEEVGILWMPADGVCARLVSARIVGGSVGIDTYKLVSVLKLLLRPFTVSGCIIKALITIITL